MDDNGRFDAPWSSPSEIAYTPLPTNNGKERLSGVNRFGHSERVTVHDEENGIFEKIVHIAEANDYALDYRQQYHHL